MTDIEQRGDRLRAELVWRLEGVLVAPIDREDLFRLSRSIDDVLDNLRDFVREWDLFDVEAAAEFLVFSGHRRRDRRPSPRGADDRRGSPRDGSVCPRRQEGRQRDPAPVRRRAGGLFRGELTTEVLKSRELLRRLDVGPAAQRGGRRPVDARPSSVSPDSLRQQPASPVPCDVSTRRRGLNTRSLPARSYSWISAPSRSLRLMSGTPSSPRWQGLSGAKSCSPLCGGLRFLPRHETTPMEPFRRPAVVVASARSGCQGFRETQVGQAVEHYGLRARCL